MRKFSDEKMKCNCSYIERKKRDYILFCRPSCIRLALASSTPPKNCRSRAEVMGDPNAVASITLLGCHLQLRRPDGSGVIPRYSFSI